MIKKVTASEKKKLKERLSKLDQKISKIGAYTWNKICMKGKYYTFTKYEEYLKIDEKRKQIRNKLKGYE